MPYCELSTDDLRGLLACVSNTLDDRTLDDDDRARLDEQRKLIEDELRIRPDLPIGYFPV
jgi:hypothetical protein